MPDNVPPTEAINERSRGLDTMPVRELVTLLIDENRRAIEAAASAVDAIAAVAEIITERIAGGGRLHYVGAGTSGRLAYLDASEMPPTFGVPADLVCAHIAGGEIALTQAAEGAEDDGMAGARAMDDEHVRPGDVVIGISASGGARYVHAALVKAAELGAYTVAICNVANAPLTQVAQTAIALDTGPEIVSGSTRLKAGTAQKLALNAISTAVMVGLGKTYDNLMVDVRATNEKLRARALRLVMIIARCDEDQARELLQRANGSVKVAVVMHVRGISVEEAHMLLDEHHGRLRACLL